MRAIRVYRFAADPARAFSPSGPLAGFEPDGVGPDGYGSPRARSLYRALGASVTDEEYQLGALPDGRWALVGLTVGGHRFVLEGEER
jgi:hypothetical protein